MSIINFLTSAALISLVSLSTHANAQIIEDQNVFTVGGTCFDGGIERDISNLIKFEAPEFSYVRQGQTYNVRIWKETISVAIDGSTPRPALWLDREVSPESDIDIEITGALFYEEIVFYWRETYQNRLYRQGLVSYDGNDLITLCNGVGGSFAER